MIFRFILAMETATDQYVYCSPFMQVSEIGLTSHEIYL